MLGKEVELTVAEHQFERFAVAVFIRPKNFFLPTETYFLSL